MKTSLVLAFLASLATTPAISASSEWFNADGARIRLISMPSPDGKTIEAGLQFELEPDWKTYWRAPGASGLPPQVNFLGSENTASVKMNLPTPKLFTDGNGVSAGYKTAVTFPIKVETLFAGRPVKLKANGVVGICGEICVPVQFNLELTETGNAGAPADVARALLSAKSNLTLASHEAQHIQQIVYDADAKRLIVTGTVPSETQAASLFVEGPFNWYLSPVEATKITAGIAEFSIDLRDMPKDAKPKEVSLRLTLVADGKGVEQEMKPQQR